MNKYFQNHSDKEMEQKRMENRKEIGLGEYLYTVDYNKISQPELNPYASYEDEKRKFIVINGGLMDDITTNDNLKPSITIKINKPINEKSDFIVEARAGFMSNYFDENIQSDAIVGLTCNYLIQENMVKNGKEAIEYLQEKCTNFRIKENGYFGQEIVLSDSDIENAYERFEKSVNAIKNLEIEKNKEIELDDKEL